MLSTARNVISVSPVGLVRAFGAAPALRAGQWSHVVEGPRDPIIGLNEAFREDADPRKLNLGVGAWRDDDGKPYVLKSVREAERRIVERGLDKEYATIAGLGEFVQRATAFVLGDDSSAIREGRVAAAQTLSGTGACRLIAAFIQRFGKNPVVYQPNPTWANHIPIFRDAGVDVRQYRYLNKDTRGLDFAGMMEDIEGAPEGSAFLLHACAHNPTGVDPTMDQWRELSRVFARKGHLACFDSAYQGFASGDPTIDAAPIRHFVAEGHDVLVGQSFAKNFGLYGERIGSMAIVTKSAAEAKAVESQLKILIRPMYSNPPLHGARIVNTILADAELRETWRKEVKMMADRIIDARRSLVRELQACGSRLDWTHITRQIGMFSYSGLSPEQVDRLREEFHIYMVRNGRISMAGVTSKNVHYLSSSIHEVSK